MAETNIEPSAKMPSKLPNISLFSKASKYDTALIKYMYNNNRMVEVAILVMYAIYGISETFLLNCFLNMSLFLYGEYLYIQFNKIPNPTQCQI